MVWNLRAKLFALGLVSSLSCAVLGAIAFMMFSQVGKAVAHNASLSTAIRLQGDADMMHDAIFVTVQSGMLAVVDGDPAALDEAREGLGENAARFRKDLTGLSGIEVGPGTLERLKAVKPALDAYIRAAEQFFLTASANPAVTELRAPFEQVKKAYEELADPMEKLSDFIEADIAEASGTLTASQHAASGAIALAMVVSLLVIGFTAWSIYRAIQVPLSAAIQAVHRVASGDLTQQVQHGRTDEIGALLNSLDDMRVSLSNMFVLFQAKAVELDEASHGLVNAAALVTQGSTAQRDASESIAATLEQMNGSIDAVADSMGGARDMAQRAGDSSSSGVRAIDTLIADMTRIDSSVKESAHAIAKLGEESKNIGAVVSVIKDIADQTNLLALNAAIEAARAGEQGRGFAVVADEVRKLAERTADSTEQIGTMIDRIQAQVSATVTGVQEGVRMVEVGVRSAQDANSVLLEITGSVRDVVSNVAQAADSMREQAVGVQHVSGSAEKISGMAEQNAVVSAEAEQSARALSAISEMLRVAAATFKVGETLPARQPGQLTAPPPRGDDKVALF